MQTEQPRSFGRWARAQQRRESHKPFTPAELAAKQQAEAFLNRARAFQERKDMLHAVLSCLEGQQAMLGVSRPLMVRDQIDDLLFQLDPSGTMTERLRPNIPQVVQPVG